jgi:hypothetical protein
MLADPPLSSGGSRSVAAVWLDGAHGNERGERAGGLGAA